MGLRTEVSWLRIFWIWSRQRFVLYEHGIFFKNYHWNSWKFATKLSQLIFHEKKRILPLASADTILPIGWRICKTLPTQDTSTDVPASNSSWFRIFCRFEIAGMITVGIVAMRPKFIISIFCIVTAITCEKSIVYLCQPNAFYTSATWNHIHKLLFIDFMASWKNQWYFIKNIPHWIIGLLKYSLLVVKLSGMCSLSQHFSLATFHRHLIDSFLMISFALTEFNFHDAFASNQWRFITVTNIQFFTSIFCDCMK